MGYLDPRQKRSHPPRCEALLGARQCREPHFLMVISRARSVCRAHLLRCVLLGPNSSLKEQEGLVPPQPGLPRGKGWLREEAYRRLKKGGAGVVFSPQ